MSDGPMGDPPNTDSTLSLHPLKLIEYPPNAFLPFAMLPPPVVWFLRPPPARTEGINTTGTRARERKTLPLGESRPSEIYPVWVWGERALSARTRASRHGRTSAAAP